MESQQYHNHMASKNLFLFQSNCILKLLLLTIVFLLSILFSPKVLQDDPNATCGAARTQPAVCPSDTLRAAHATRQRSPQCSAEQLSGRGTTR